MVDIFCVGISVIAFLAVVIYTISSFVFEKIKIENLQSRTVLVTGCDSGFGHWLVLKLLENGLSVYAGCLTEGGQRGLNTAAASDGIGENLETFPLDVTSHESVDDAVKFFVEAQENQKLWALVNNAGIAGKPMPDDFLTDADYKTVLEVNLHGTIRMCQAFKPFIKNSNGRIINCASIAGRMVVPGMGPYCVSKHAVEIYSDILRYELRPFNVTIHILEPSAFQTQICAGIAEKKITTEVWNSASQQIRDEYGEAYLSAYQEHMKSVFGTKADPDYMKVVDAYFHAITAKEKYMMAYNDLEKSKLYHLYVMKF